VNNVNTTVIHNTYNQTVVNNVTINKVSYNGGAGGVAAAPTPQERTAAREQHVAPTPMQRQHVQEAVRNPALAARANGGHPSIAATPRPAAFNAPGVMGAHGAATPPRAPGAAAAVRTGQPSGAPLPRNGAAQPQAANGRPAGQTAGSPKPQPPKSQPAKPQPKKGPPEGKKREPER
jgi:hypothetical protein